MIKKKRWITALVIIVLCTSLVIVYASVKSYLFINTIIEFKVVVAIGKSAV